MSNNIKLKLKLIKIYLNGINNYIFYILIDNSYKYIIILLFWLYIKISLKMIKNLD